MKKLTFYAFIICFYSCYSTEKKEGIWSSLGEPEIGIEHTFSYKPTKGIDVPDNAYAHLYYLRKGKLDKQIVKLEIQEDFYDFSVSIPDFTEMFVVSIFDKRKHLLDNNYGNGYFISINDKQINRKKLQKLNIAKLKLSRARFDFSLKVSRNELNTLFQETYNNFPDLKEGEDYIAYLRLQYYANRDSLKPVLLQYAKELETAGDEAKMTQAIKIYGLLQLPIETSKVENNIIESYPYGVLASERFLIEFDKNIDQDVDELLSKMESYFDLFGLTNHISEDDFFIKFVHRFLEARELDRTLEYGGKIVDKDLLIETYNHFANHLLAEPSTSENDLLFAKAILRSALKYSSVNSTDNFEVSNNRSVYFSAMETYAGLLNKISEQDSAFYFQNMLLNNHQLDIRGIERYALWSEAIEGLDFTREFIETQLGEGVYSVTLLNKLRILYDQLQLSDVSFDSLKHNYMVNIRDKSEKEIESVFGTVKAPEFTLNNLDGQTVSLSDYKGKVVVLDFWATWCSPCIASFPTMQKLIAENKTAGDIEFLFMDVQEQGSKREVEIKVTELMKKNSYDFNVLFDENDIVFSNYKIDVLPHKYVIDKKGNIAFMNLTSADLKEELEFEIDAARLNL